MSQTVLYALGNRECLGPRASWGVRKGQSEDLTVDLSFSGYPPCLDHSYLLCYGNCNYSVEWLIASLLENP